MKYLYRLMDRLKDKKTALRRFRKTSVRLFFSMAWARNENALSRINPFAPRQCIKNSYFSLSAAWAAASLAIGTRNGEQDT